MSHAAARSILALKSKTAGTLLLAACVECDLAQKDGVDAEGRSVVLIGRHRLETGDSAGPAFVEVVLQALRKGRVPNGVHHVVYAPQASAGLQAIVEGPAREVLLVGQRETGKTMVPPAAMLILAEWHHRAGLALPLIGLALADTLVSFEMKLARSLTKEPMWGDLWSLKNDAHQAIASLGGVPYVQLDAVGVLDQNASERLKQRCHVVIAEELIPTDADGGGIPLEKYMVAMSSMSLDTPRHVVASTTNPGSPRSVYYQKFISPGSPRCVALTVDRTDRMSEERIAAIEASFVDSPELFQRLARGEWVVSQQGLPVATGFRREVHVSDRPLLPQHGFPFVLGGDGGATPASIVAQFINGTLRVYACLCSTRAGTRQHLNDLVLPWFASHAPWALGATQIPRTYFYDPSMETGDQGDIDSSPVNVIRQLLQCDTEPGPMSWPGRRDPLLTMLAQLNPATGRARLQINSSDCTELIHALEGGAHYKVVNGEVARDKPVKNHPDSDCLDALCYVIANLSAMPIVPRDVRVESAFSLQLGPGASFMNTQKGFPWS